MSSQFTHVDEELKFCIYRFPILFWDVFWEQY